MKIPVATLVVLVCFATRLAWAYDIGTHRALGDRAAANAAGLEQILIEDLGLLDGRDTVLQQGEVPSTVQTLIQDGAWQEDEPFWRVLNHFHNPLQRWDAAGLTLDLAFGIPLGRSSIVWSQQPVQTSTRGGSTWSWPLARQRLLAALTGGSRSQRQAAFADTFRALGHLTHLIQDATVPAHVRNDAHPWLPVGHGMFLPLNSDWYEDWVEDIAEHKQTQFESIVAGPPERPLRLVLHSEHPEAPIPIAGLIDTDQYATDGPIPSVLGPNAFGVAELTNANFVSRDTMLDFFPRPILADIGAPFVEQVGDAYRRYFPKVVRGTAIAEIPHFVAESALAPQLRAVSSAPPASTLWTLDERVHEDYARLLLPRAIGYSAELLDYFLRGRLDVDVELDPANPGVVRLTGSNASLESLYDGTLGLYADTLDGQRVPATALDPSAVIGVGPGETLIPTRFEAPADAERFVAVYQGTLGLERKSETFPGAVIGKVLGGVRVEELFADGARWRLRTPTGVFDLPLATATYESVTWGDADDVIVARTALADDPPGFVATFSIVRQPGSVEPLTSGTPAVVELRPQGFASLTFAEAPLVTTIAFDQTIDHQQQIGRCRHDLFLEWTTAGNFYRTASVSRIPVQQFETLYQQTVAFAGTMPIRLDAAHNFDLGDEDQPYVWQLVDVASDRGGRILGLAAIYLTQPSLAPVDVPWFRLDAAGQPFVAQMLRLQPEFPEDASTIWALVDLGAGAVVASTAGPTVGISNTRANEAPPWGAGGFGSTQFPGIYRHSVTHYSGGDLSGRVEESWDVLDLALSRSPSGQLTVLETRTGDTALTVAGWFRPEIRAALQRSGLDSFQVGEVQQATQFWNYMCLTSPCSSDSDYAGVALTGHRGGVLSAPAQLVDARRARPAPAGERLVLLGDAFHEDFRPIGSVIAWDADAGRAREAFAVPASFHGLGSGAASSAVLLSFYPSVEPSGTFLVGLEEGALESFFADQDLTFDFTPLAPGRLYGVRDFRFYRTEPPLQAMPLPARLVTLPRNPIGDYHAIRLP